MKSFGFPHFLLAKAHAREMIAVTFLTSPSHPMGNAVTRYFSEFKILKHASRDFWLTNAIQFFDGLAYFPIITALSLDRPKGRSLAERRFLEPFVQRVFGDYPDMEYAQDARRGKLPPNVTLSEFFLKTGADVGNREVQCNYIYSNYTHAVRDAFAHGVNVFAQAMAIDET